MRKTFSMVATLGFVGLPAMLLAKNTPPPEIPPASWTPQEATKWQMANAHYHQVVQRFGVNSPQATQARKDLDILAQQLGEKRPHFPNQPDPNKVVNPAKPDTLSADEQREPPHK